MATVAAKRKRTTSKRTFNRLANALEQILQGDSPQMTIQRRYVDLKDTWREVQATHDEYIDSLEEDADVEAEDAWLNELSDIFYKLEIQMDLVLDERKEVNSEEVNGDLKQTKTVKQSTVQIERMKFDIFDGDIRKYPKFKDEFLRYIEPLCKDNQLPFILKSYLSESIRDDVENVGENMEAIWERLDRKYGNEDRIVDAILADIKHLRDNQNDDQTTLEMIKIIEKANNDLTRMNKRVEMQNSTIISIIEEKMSSEMYEEWVKEITANIDIAVPKFEKLLSFMNQWRNRIEYKIAGIRNLEERIAETNHGQGLVKRQYYSQKQKCWIHKVNDDHPIWRCRVFQNKSVEERIQLARENHACFSCLEVGHDSTACTKGFKCKQTGCNQTHNQLLHQTSPGVLNFHAQKFSEPNKDKTILPLQ